MVEGAMTMDILKIIQTLQTYSEDFVAYKLDGRFAHAVTEAVSLLIEQGERIADLEAKLSPCSSIGPGSQQGK